jgi:hypothetical protein
MFGKLDIHINGTVNSDNFSHNIRVISNTHDTPIVTAGGNMRHQERKLTMTWRRRR